MSHKVLVRDLKIHIAPVVVWLTGKNKDRPNIYYMASGNGVCVENCPMTTNYTEFICYDEVYPEIYDNDTGEVCAHA